MGFQWHFFSSSSFLVSSACSLSTVSCLSLEERRSSFACPSSLKLFCCWALKLRLLPSASVWRLSLLLSFSFWCLEFHPQWPFFSVVLLYSPCSFVVHPDAYHIFPIQLQQTPGVACRSSLSEVLQQNGCDQSQSSLLSRSAGLLLLLCCKKIPSQQWPVHEIATTVS